MFKKVLVTAVALAMSAGAAHAGEKNKLTKEEGVGMFSGAAAGAIVGGPIGAAVGFMFGGILGDSVGTANRAQLQAKQMEEQSQKLEQELIDTRIALAKASERTGGDEMLDALAQRLHADVLFRTNDATMEADVASKLEDLGKLLALHGELEVQLHGFADPRGKSEKNLELSLERANAVREALIRGGAAPEQIQLSAHGSDLTTAPKGDLEAYAWERRVSLSIRPTATSAVARNE
ncbi:membrane protein [Steroidobacter agaridevorans]|uniref:Membrane protein n=1 Tax=Steroidobacter agaridevorans TaxID=2695856 RepID=A0A829YRC5_9GAMM|nr:OmpA family protein [Steroidobacter agaridevorans]GFE84986.1 membrane protein [Steroidobacter agaridevorans]